MATAFQVNAFQSNAFQEAAVSNYVLSGSPIQFTLTIISANLNYTNKSAANTGSGGGYYFSSYGEEKLNKLREKSKHRTFVREAAVEAVVSNYYSTTKKTNDDAIRRLKVIAADLQFKIAEADMILLREEIKVIRMMQQRDEEEAELLLL